MKEELIFAVTAAWDAEAGVWVGHCDDIPAAASAADLDELLERMSAMAFDLLPDNYPRVEPASVLVRMAF